MLQGNISYYPPHLTTKLTSPVLYVHLCRNMWAEFEWENKVAVNTTFTDCNSFLQHIVATTNMQCLTPPTALDGEFFFSVARFNE